MKKLNWKSVVGCIAAVILIFVIIGYNAYQAKQQTIIGKKKVYAILPLTGMLSGPGEQFKSAINTWVKQNPDALFDVVFLDNEGKTAQAVNIVNQIQLTDKKPIILTVATFLTKPLIPVTKDGFIFGATILPMSDVFSTDNFQQLGYSEEGMLRPLLPFIQAGKKYTILTSYEDFGIRSSNFFEKMIIERNGILIQKIPLDFNSIDVRIEALKALSGNPDFIFISGQGISYVNIIKQLISLGYTGQILTDIALNQKYVVDALGSLANGVISTIIPVQDFKKNYPVLTKELEQNGLYVNYQHATIVDALNIIQYTLENDLPFTQDTYTKMGKWSGVSGNITFPGKGDGLYSFIAVQYKDGEFVPVE